MSQTYNLTVPPVVFGTDCAATIAAHIQRLGARSVLLVSDPGVAKAGLVDKLAGWIQAGGITVRTYTRVEPEPSVESARACTADARANRCEMIVGMGGGSAMDTAKTVAMLMGNAGDLMDYLGQNRVPRKGVPTILLPTTAGTGSEVGRGALFYVPERQAKESIFSPYLLTDLAMIDPALTVSAPASVTAASGIDALCHAIESYTSRSATPFSEPYAERGIELIAQHLRGAVSNGSDLAAREGMALGSLFASLSLANATSHVVHAMAYPLQGHNRIVHGLANGVLLAHVLRAIASGDVKKFARVAGWMGVPVEGLSLLEAAQAGVGAVQQLAAEIGIPAGMGKLGVSAAQLDEFAAEAYNIRRLMDNSPCELSLDEVRAIFEAAL
jgi:alcohol dehydrogenase